MRELHCVVSGQSRALLVSAVLALGLAVSPTPVIAQVSVDGDSIALQGGYTFNAFWVPCTQPVCYRVLPPSAAMIDTGDVFVESALEVGNALYLNRKLYMDGDIGAGKDGDQRIYFYDNDAREGESLRWDESEDSFVFSDDLRLAGSLFLSGSFYDHDFAFKALDDVEVLLDMDANGDGWWRVTHEAGEILAQIKEGGDLRIRGPLVQNTTTFDVAEGFMMAEPVRPGDVVSIVRGNPHAIQLASKADGSSVLGVVSSKPGVFLGGGFFDEAGIAEWGPELLARYRAERFELATAILTDWPELNSQLAELGLGVAPLLDEDAAALSEEALSARSELSDLIMERFAAQQIAPVALAGRVPVTVDASFGAIEIGDLLTISAIPGIARKADGPGVILGTALEALVEGPGRILMLVGRGYTDGLTEGHARRSSDEGTIPEGANIVATQRSELAVAYARIGELEERLAHLERFLQTAYDPERGTTVVAAVEQSTDQALRFRGRGPQ